MSQAPDQDRIRLEPGWKSRLLDAFAAPSMQALREFLLQERGRGRTLFPPARQIFAALDATPFDQVKVVILGQDPYHGPGQAHGLSFSVPPGVPPPPSLQNIFAELERDLHIPRPDHGCLLPWAQRGVLLLNAVLTVEKARAGSHQKRGWEEFTDQVIARLAEDRENLVFLLWGSYAQKKGQVIDARRHRVLRAPHPSPLSAHRGFIGCGHFSAANRYLQQHGIAPIDWRLPARAELDASLSES
ncbi:uracil-DNA glycosylase [Denitratimonas sp. CY0512]|uniref:uracil-DNA glycosylase n=1 Tax=Denitratimonas sp. CY0512 TaxID=3131940 RepID=UPI003094FACE